MPTPSLKLEEKQFDPMNPWSDDALDRKVVADALTNLLKGETQPLVISLHGDWGTGKTFLLKRWHQELENKEQKAIYFNAWEDDFLGDPLIAIFGQLKRVLQGPSWTEIRNSVQEAFMPILTKTACIAVKKATLGFVELDKKTLSSTAESTFDEYQKLRKAKEELKKRLTKMAEEIVKETGQPLIFIVDELDRCRPTFSIELLERVKHLFDIPNIVFVFGVDRNQLKSSIQAVYGEINAEGYLRRFFDMDFTLPPAKPDKFCKCLIKRHELDEYFQSRGNTIKNSFNKFNGWFPRLCMLMGLSLRDIEHCLRLFVMSAKNTPDDIRLFPELLGILLMLRIKNHDLYLECFQGKSSAPEIIDYFDKFSPNLQDEKQRDRTMLDIEHLVYGAHIDGKKSSESMSPITMSLVSLQDNKELSDPSILAKRTLLHDKNRLRELLETCVSTYDETSQSEASKQILAFLSEKIELAAMMIDE